MTNICTLCISEEFSRFLSSIEKKNPNSQVSHFGVICGYHGGDNYYVTTHHEYNINFNGEDNEYDTPHYIDFITEIDLENIEYYLYQLHSILIPGIDIFGFYVVSSDSIAKLQSQLSLIFESLIEYNIFVDPSIIILHYNANKYNVKQYYNRQYTVFNIQIINKDNLMKFYTIKEQPINILLSLLNNNKDGDQNIDFDYDYYSDILDKHFVLDNIYVPLYPNIYHRMKEGQLITLSCNVVLKYCQGHISSSNEETYSIKHAILSFIRYFIDDIYPNISYNIANNNNSLNLKLYQVDLSDNYFRVFTTNVDNVNNYIKSLLGPKYSYSSILRTNQIYNIKASSKTCDKIKENSDDHSNDNNYISKTLKRSWMSSNPKIMFALLNGIIVFIAVLYLMIKS